MSKASRWKSAENGIAVLLQKFKVPAKRRLDRNTNFSLSIDDVEIDGHPEIITDSKYSVRGFSNTRLLDTIEEKYCKSKDDFGVLWTKGYRERGFTVTIRGDFFAMLLSFWLGFATKEDLLKIYKGK